MGEDINALGSSAQDVNVKKCTHLALRVRSGKIRFRLIIMVRKSRIY